MCLRSFVVSFHHLFTVSVCQFLMTVVSILTISVTDIMANPITSTHLVHTYKESVIQCGKNVICKLNDVLVC